MKKNLFVIGLMAMSLGFAACGDDEDVKTTEPGTKSIPEGTADVTIETNNIDVTSGNIANWGTYAKLVAQLLKNDAKSLNDAWTTGGYAETFKTHGAPFVSYGSCIEQIIDGCIDIAGEVGEAKIGEPRDLWEAGKYTEAVYAVESWYSFHSIDDYSNNIQSIRHAFNGTRGNSEAENSIASYLKSNNSALYAEMKAAIDNAYNAVKGMKAPFRSYIGSNTVLAAMDACSVLDKALDNKLKSYMNSVEDEAALQRIVENYVEQVVLPTYADLVIKNEQLYDAVSNLALSPSTSTFKAAANAWLEAREPWETSEAFLFGPVADLGLDPNMDSWPLDADAIKKVLEEGDFNVLNWDGEFDDENEEIAAAQNLRGYHTLEFLLFKDGQPRTYAE